MMTLLLATFNPSDFLSLREWDGTCVEIESVIPDDDAPEAIICLPNHTKVRVLVSELSDYRYEASCMRCGCRTTYEAEEFYEYKDDSGKIYCPYCFKRVSM